MWLYVYGKSSEKLNIRLEYVGFNIFIAKIPFSDVYTEFLASNQLLSSLLIVECNRYCRQM